MNVRVPWWKKITQCIAGSAYAHELCAVMCAALALFFGVSLISYSPYDSSWFFYSSSPQPLQNACGIVGSYTAALLFYLLGSASLFVPLLMLGGSVALLLRKSLHEEWDRMLAAVMFVALWATMLSAYRFDMMGSTVPGGLIGSSLHELLYRLFDHVGTVLFVITGLLMSFVIISRLSFVYLAQQLLCVVRFVFSWQRFWAPVFGALRYAAQMVAVPCLWIARMIKKLWDGTLVAQHDDFMEIEQLVMEHEAEEIGNDPFWQKIIHADDASGEEEETPRSYEFDGMEEHDEFLQSYHPEQELTGYQEFDITVQQEKRVAPALHEQEVEEAQECNLNAAHAYAHEQELKERSYRLPQCDIFIGVPDEQDDRNLMKELEQRAQTLTEKLQRFGVQGTVTAIKRGPVVTLFEYQPDIDTKISKIIALEDDLAMALQALSIRILAPIPGRSVVGFEVANSLRRAVSFAKLVRSDAFQDNRKQMPLIVGEDTIGAEVIVDLVAMPHLLIAGSTGSGKSVALNGMLVSLLCRHTPDELKLILIDPKRLEFAGYADIAHLLFPIVVDPRKASPVLKWVVGEMERRYEEMALFGVRNIGDYNKRAVAQKDVDKLPYIVVVIDELADLMMTAGRDTEDQITRITQMARAAGIHLIVATQRPSVDVITGLIKVNFPSRISFRVTSKIDSRTILDCSGAEKLLGRGDMLLLDSQGLRRVHGAYVSDEEITRLVDHIRAERQVEYLELPRETAQGCEDDDQDDLYGQVVDFLQEVDEVSISLLQRRFRIGYNRSARIIDMLESRGAILPADGGKVRKVLK